jgi:hypothetical protein
MSTNTPEAKSSGAHDAPDSLQAAAASFQSRLFPQGDKRKPGEVSPPESKGAPEPEIEEVEETVADEPEVEETEEVEEPETEEAAETTDEVETVEDAESEDEQPEVTEPEETETTAEKRSRKLKLPDGTEEEVSEDEAYQGYLRTKDYTRKTQAAAEAKKRADAAEAEARANAARHAAELANVKAAMDRLVPKEPNWPELRKTLSAEEYANVRDEWTAFKTERDRIEAEQKAIADEQKAAFDKEYSSWREAEIEKLKAAVPEWVDADRGSKEVGAMAQYMLSIGYQQPEVDAAVDHRFLLMLRKAWLWDKAQKAGETKVKPKVSTKGKIKSAPPGGKSTPVTPKSQAQRDAETLRKTGSLAAAASVFDNLLKRGSPRR